MVTQENADLPACSLAEHMQKIYKYVKNIEVRQSIWSTFALCTLVGNRFLIKKNLKTDHLEIAKACHQNSQKLEPSRIIWSVLIAMPFISGYYKISKCKNIDQKSITNTLTDVSKVWKIGKLWIKLHIFLNIHTLYFSTSQ